LRPQGTAVQGNLDRPQIFLWSGLPIFVAALLSALGAIWLPDWVVTQDNPAHLYNAHIISRSWDPQSPFRHYYRVNWAPLPNWAGHCLDVVVLSILPARLAEKMTMSVTLTGFATSIIWLRRRVVGWQGMPLAALLAMLLALNMLWLVGFTSFLLGSCLFVITLGVWWDGRDTLRFWRVAALAALISLGYLSHLVSLGLTVVGLVLLAVSIRRPDRVLRLSRTAVSLLPLIPLGLLYLGLAPSGARMAPGWSYLSHPFSVRSWLQQIMWADPLSLVSRGRLFSQGGSPWMWGGLVPVLLALAVLAIGMFAGLKSIRDQRWPGLMGGDDRFAWVVLATVLVTGGLFGPDVLGDGSSLSQRVVLLGLVAAVPVLGFRSAGWGKRACTGALAVALALQSVVLWHYALYCDANVGNLMCVRQAAGEGRRLGTLLNHVRPPFRANPLLHADMMLGIGTGNIIWNNYETLFSYFPVHFREGIKHPPVAVMDEFGLDDDNPAFQELRRQRWDDLLLRHHAEIDELLVWGYDPWLDAVSDRWYQTVFQTGEVRLQRRREPSGPL
jgi:hypothetical protein